MKIMVLNDGQTYTDLSGCSIIADQGVSKSLVIRRAVGLMKYLADERSEGGKVRGAAPYAPPEVDGRR